jgi:hypothetical protein
MASDKEAEPETHVVAEKEAEPEPQPEPEPESQPESQPPAPAFEPLFTLLTNTTTGATIHPHVQYLFSDDDTSVLSAAHDDPAHRAVVVDLAPSGGDENTWRVQWASSLSADFAITGSQLVVQPNNDTSEGDASMMLRLEGAEREPLDASASGGSRPGSLPSSSSGALGREDVDSLADEFKRRVAVLKRVVGEGERRRGVMDKLADARAAEGDKAPLAGERESAVQGGDAYEDEFPG